MLGKYLNMTIDFFNVIIKMTMNEKVRKIFKIFENFNIHVQCKIEVFLH